MINKINTCQIKIRWGKNVVRNSKYVGYNLFTMTAANGLQVLQVTGEAD